MAEKKRRYTRSVSQYKQVTRCGEAFRLSRLVKPRPPKRPAAWTGLGIAVHTAFQQWEEHDRQQDVVELFEAAYDEWTEEALQQQPNLDLWILPPGSKSTKNTIKNYRKRGVEKDVPLYRDRCLEAEWEILQLGDSKAIELEYEIELPNPKAFRPSTVVKGSVDRVLWYPKLKRVALEDLKTGSPDDDQDYRQLDMYALALREVYDIDVKFGRFWYTKLDRPGEWRKLDKTKEHIGEAYAIVDAIIDQGLLLPSPGKICGLCDVKPWCSEVGYLKPGEELTSENLGGK